MNESVSAGGYIFLGFIIASFAMVFISFVIGQVKQRRLNKLEPYEFRKKPVKIQAVQVLEVDEEDGISLGGRGRGMANGAPEWLTKAINQNDIIVGNQCLFINTQEGQMRLDEGDWLIRGVEGELYPCDPVIFSKTYD